MVTKKDKEDITCDRIYIENQKEVVQNYQGLEFLSGSQDWENIFNIRGWLKSQRAKLQAKG